MEIKQLFLKNFRSYKEKTFTFSSGINLIHGPNGSGKTNLIEAIYLLSTGRSFRTNHLTDLISYGEPFFHIELLFKKDEITQSLTFSFDGRVKKICYNNNPLSAASLLLGILPSVLYAPSDIHLVSHSPSVRRRFMNLILGQSDPLYIHYLMRYQKALKQRNHLLKTKKKETMELWEEVLSTSAAAISKKREVLCCTLETMMNQIGKEIAPKTETFHIDYLPSIPLQYDYIDCYRKSFEKHRSKEFRYGISLTGPHRDEITFLLNQKSVKHFSSEGQKRTCILTLKLAEWEMLQKNLRTLPLMFVDDFGMHLDLSRIQYLEHKLSHLHQVFLTTPQLYSSSRIKAYNAINILSENAI